jgi:hypothetical protein
MDKTFQILSQGEILNSTKFKYLTYSKVHLKMFTDDIKKKFNTPDAPTCNCGICPSLYKGPTSRSTTRASHHPFTTASFLRYDYSHYSDTTTTTTTTINILW